MSETKIEWQDPPPAARIGARVFVAEAEGLRAHPKRWALLKTYPAGVHASAFKSLAVRGRKAAFRPAEDWEFRVSGCDLYARYVGGAA